MHIQAVTPAHRYPALVAGIQSCLRPQAHPSKISLRGESQCLVILPPIPPHQKTKRRNKQAAGERIWPILHPAACAICTATVKAQRSGREIIELAQ